MGRINKIIQDESNQVTLYRLFCGAGGTTVEFYNHKKQSHRRKLESFSESTVQQLENILENIDMTNNLQQQIQYIKTCPNYKIFAVDLFCGAGGETTGIELAKVCLRKQKKKRKYFSISLVKNYIRQARNGA